MSSDITFRCNRCTGTITVQEAQIGTKIYCPNCFQELKVPSVSSRPVEEADPEQVYVVDNEIKDVREMGQWLDYRSALCPRCKTSIAIKQSDCGKEITCPDCDKVFTVPENAFDTNKDVFGNTLVKKDSVPKEIYELTDPDKTPEEPLEIPPEKKSFPIHCPLCNTLLYATYEQIGQIIQCPDCERQFPVRAPAAAVPISETAPVSYEGGTTYQIQGESPDSTSMVSDSEEKMVRVICKHCGTMMYAPVSDIGKTKKCPDCFFENPIIAKTKEQELLEEKIQPNVQGEYRIQQETKTDRPPAFLENSFLLRRGKSNRELAEEEEAKERAAQRAALKERRSKNSRSKSSKSASQKKSQLSDYVIDGKKYKIKRLDDCTVFVTPPPPQFAIIYGLFQLLFDSECIRRLLFFMIIGAFLFGVGGSLYLPVLQTRKLGFAEALFIIPVTIFLVACLLLWLRNFPLLFLSLFQDSSTGNTQVDEWMDEGLIGGFFLSCWIVAVLVVTGILPLVIDFFVPMENSLVKFLICYGLYWFFLPIFFLSMSQTNSGLLCWNIIISLFRCFLSWCSFYFVSLIIVEIPFFIWIYYAKGKPGLFFGYLCCHILPMIYAILLGRMAWIIEDDLRNDN